MVDIGGRGYLIKMYMFPPSNSQWYCWWTKSCTTKDGDYPMIHRVLTIPGGAGFLPSTVSVVYLFLGDEMKHLEQFSTSILGRFLFGSETYQSGSRKRSNITFLISSSIWDLFQSLAFTLNFEIWPSKVQGLDFFDFFVVPGWLSWKLSHLGIYCIPCRKFSHLYWYSGIFINLQNISIVHTRSRWGTLNKIY